MRKTMLTTVRFNRRQNEKLFALLDTLDDEKRKADRKGLHNGSIHGAMDRILDTEIFTLNILSGAKTVDVPGLAAPYVTPPRPGAPGPARHDGPPPEGSAPPMEHDFSIKFPDYADLKAAFAVVDRAYVTIYETLGDDELRGGGALPHDEVLKAMFMGTLIRGQVTQMLNEYGVHSDLIAGPLLS